MKNIFYIENRVDSDRSDPVLSDETIRIRNIPLVKSYDKKNLLKIATMTTLSKSESFQSYRKQI